MKDLRKLFYQFFLGKGIKIASKELYDKRMDICRSNPCGVYKNPLGLKILEKCGACGCFLRAKNDFDKFIVNNEGHIGNTFIDISIRHGITEKQCRNIIYKQRYKTSKDYNIMRE